MFWLLACGSHHTLRTVASSPDGGAAPETRDAERPALETAAPSVDSASEGGVVDPTTVSRCGSQVSFHIAPAPGLDTSTLCPFYGCETMSATISSGAIQFGAGSYLSPAESVMWSGLTINGCGLLCDTCQEVFCHSCVVLGIFTRLIYDRVWDGSYFLQGTCNGEACMGPTACAPAGHYVANFCVQKGVTAKEGLSDVGCYPLSELNESLAQPLACGSVEFDLPSTVWLSVNLGGAAGTRGPIDPGLPSALLDLVGSYRVSSSSGGFGSVSESKKLQFTDVDMVIAKGSDSDLVVVTNPLPGDFPGSCSIPVNIVADASGNWSLQNPATTCTSGGATVTLYPGYFTLTGTSASIALSAAGSSTGGTQSATQTFAFAYSGIAVRAP